MLNVPFRGEILQNLSLWLAFNGVAEGTTYIHWLAGRTV